MFQRLRSFTWVLHLVAWVAYSSLPLLFMDSGGGRHRYFIMGWFLQSIMILYFYYNYLWLIPRFLMTRRFWLYAILLVAGFMFLCLLNSGYSFISTAWIKHRYPYSFWRSFFFPLYPLLMAFAFSTGIRITIEWFRNERKRKEMETEKLTSELAFLKSQINPHFLFNTLNNICSLARKKSEETENAIIKLSEIMRYMLQDSGQEKVGLDKEVDYLNNYIELQKMRLSGSVEVRFDVVGDCSVVLLEPLLLIPFVENAFKHGISYEEPCGIEIRLDVQPDALKFTVSNRIVSSGEDNKDPGSGIGLKNVIRRLELLYPDRHWIHLQRSESWYHVELLINLA